MRAPAYDPFLSKDAWRERDAALAAAPFMPQGKAPERPGRFTEVVLSIVLPWLVFVLVTALFIFVFHEMEMVVWILSAFCACLALLFMVFGCCARRGALLAIGFLCLTSVGIGSAVGLWLQSEYLDRYWELDAGQEFKEVQPSASARSTHGAAIIRFAPGTFVDDRRTLGFVTGGGILCVAPVVSTSGFQHRVEYWAVGEDCCEMRCNFDCGTSRESGAVSTVTEPRGSGYTRAIAQAISVYGINSTAEAQLVSFVADPRGVISDIFDETLTIAMIAMIMDLGMCTVAGMVIARLLSNPAQEPYDRDR